MRSIALLLFIVAQCTALLTLYSNNATRQYHAVSAGFPRFEPDITVNWNGPIAMAFPTDGCTPLVDPVDGYITVVLPGGCYPVIKARHLQAAGAVGIIIFSYSGQLGGVKYLTMTNNENDVVIPMVEVSSLDQSDFLDFAIAQNPNVTVILEPNQFEIYYEARQWILYSATIGAINLFLVIFGCYRIYGFLVTHRPYVGFYTYLLIVISSALRILNLIDPNSAYGVIPRSVVGILFGFPLVFNIAASITTAFHWAEIFDESKLRTNLTGLGRFRIHCVIVIVIIFILDIIQVAVGSALINLFILTIVAGAFNTVCNISVCIFFAYACHLIRMYIRDNASMKETRRFLIRLLVLGCIQCACLIAYFIIGVTFATPIAVDFRTVAMLSAFLNVAVTLLATSQSFMFADPLQRQPPTVDIPTKTSGQDIQTDHSTRSDYDESEEITLP